MNKKTIKPRGKSSHKASSNHKGAISQVRIIGGQFKRRQLSFIDADGLRPTPDRLRETLFNWLMYDLLDASIIDCCAGSGVLGFEALSRGARHCTFIEANPKQSQMLVASQELLKIDHPYCQILTGQAQTLLSQPSLSPQISKFLPFDVAFIDPPYELDLWYPIVAALIKQQHINGQSLLYLEADRPIDSLFYVANSDNDAQDGHNIVSTDIQLNCLKQTKVGQIHAGLYQYLDSND